jgi:hypothetical protein
MTIETLIETTFHTADADARMQAADAAFLIVFMALKGEARAARWRGLDSGAKFRLVVRQIEQLGKTWMPSVVEAQIAKYDARYAAGPLDAAIEGALERLAFDNAQRAETADKADRAFFRRNATSYTNALDQYRRGVRPERLTSGARLIPSSQPGRPAHLITMDGDWTCSCQARTSMHWPLALCIGIEQAFEDMQQYDDGDVSCDPPDEPNPMGDEEGDSLPVRAPWYARASAVRSAYAYI